MKRFLIAISCAAIVVACGTTSKVTSDNAPVGRVATPTQAQADSLLTALVSPAGEFRTFVVETEDRPQVYGFVPSSDSASVRVITLAPQKGKWAMESSASYPDGDDAQMRFSGFADSTLVVSIGGRQRFVYVTMKESDSQKQKLISIYTPSLESLQQVVFTGKALPDGKIEGSSNEKLLDGVQKPEMQWALSKLHEDPSLVFLSEADIMTDQAIAWWLEKNPAALTKATKVTFGQIPAESSLAIAFNAAKKENSDKYRAAYMDIRGYTCVVAYNKSAGTYSLAWVEPVCKNKSTDRLLKSIYFGNGSFLSLFYYKGRTSFKYNLNLANGILQR